MRVRDDLRSLAKSLQSGPHPMTDLTRLKAVQARVRALALKHDWFADAIRTAFTGYLDLCASFRREESAMRERERALARDLLVRHLLFDPKARDNSPCVFVRIEGLCPSALAERLSKHGLANLPPKKLEREGAAAALAAFDREVIYQAHDLSAKMQKAMIAEWHSAVDQKTHVPYSWMIVVSRPSDWREPVHCHSLDREDLEQFKDEDYRTIALHRLGGLADVGLVRPIVPKPKETGNALHDLDAFFVWRCRLPVKDDHRDQNQPPLNVEAFPADVAEQMLVYLKVWITRESKRGEDLPVERFGRRRMSATSVDDGFRPATWFSKGMAARLRMAAQKKRKTKRVATRRTDGVVCYSVADARRWWPKEVPKDP